MHIDTHDTQSLNKTTFILNDKSIIIGLGSNWDHTLIQPSQSLKANNLIGNSLFNYVNGDATQIWLGAMLQKAKVAGYCTNKYRCDSAEEIRYCSMLINYTPDKCFIISHHTINHQYRALNYECSITTRSAKASDESFAIHSVVCSNCCKVEYGNHFVEVNDYCVLTKNMPHHVFGNHPTYTICPDCEKNTK